MLKTKHILFIFLPAVAIAAFALFIRLVQYEPLFPKEEETTSEAPETTQIPIFPDDPILGDKKAGMTLIAFEDLGCAACAEQDELFTQLLEKYPSKIKIIWKPLPVTFVPFSTSKAHEYAYCANKQKKFDKFKTLAFTNRLNLSPETLQNIGTQIELNQEKLTACLESGEAAAYTKMAEELGRALNIQSVPTIFLENMQIDHPTTVEGWETLLQL